MGSIGTDSFGDILIEKSVQVGLLTSFQTTSSKATGKCACLIHGPFRSLVAYLDAADDFNPGHLDTVKNEIISANYLYITGFFYSVSPISVKRILGFGPRGKIIFNLSATFVPDMIEEDDFDSIMRVSYILIGNSDEFDHLEKKLGFTCEEAKSKFNFTDILAEKYPTLTIIITQGSDPIILKSSGVTKEIPVPPVEKVIDTNGAGDAFVGGILGGLERNFSLIDGIKIGCFLAGRVISQNGIHPPSRKDLESIIMELEIE